MTVAIVDYGSGNLRSAAKAFERAARESGLDDRVLVTANPHDVAAADRIVLPGVGAFADCRAGLYGVPGMVDTLQAGSDALVIADPNEEGANLLALNTRAQIAQTTLSMASQSDSAVMRLLQ